MLFAYKRYPQPVKFLANFVSWSFINIPLILCSLPILIATIAFLVAKDQFSRLQNWLIDKITQGQFTKVLEAAQKDEKILAQAKRLVIDHEREEQKLNRPPADINKLSDAQVIDLIRQKFKS